MTLFEKKIIESIRNQSTELVSECCKAKINPILIEVKTKKVAMRCSKCGEKLEM